MPPQGKLCNGVPGNTGKRRGDGAAFGCPPDDNRTLKKILNKSFLDFSESGNKKRGFCFPPFLSGKTL
jgi:hypothetical protein